MILLLETLAEVDFKVQFYSISQSQVFSFKFIQFTWLF